MKRNCNGTCRCHKKGLGHFVGAKLWVQDDLEFFSVYIFLRIKVDILILSLQVLLVALRYVLTDTAEVLEK